MKNVLTALVFVTLIPSMADARVVRLIIEQREVVAGGASMGSVGPYERLVGTAYFEVDPNDPLNPNRGNPAGRGRGGPPADSGPFDPKVPFGHLHAGSAEWWIVLVGHISGKFETGEVIGAEGDVLYAPPYTWHQMANSGAGASCRFTFGAYDPVNFAVVRE